LGDEVFFFDIFIIFLKFIIFLFYRSTKLFLDWTSQLNHVKTTPTRFNFKFMLGKEYDKKKLQDWPIKSLFGIVVAVAVQSNFHLKMH